MKFTRGLLNGVTAGAAGTTALNVVSGADAVLRARPASRAPEQLVAAVADRAGVEVPGGPSERRNRLAALGPLAGSATGLVVGAVAGGLRAAGLRLPTVVGGPLLGAAAMIATDGPLALTRVSDPRTWSAADWTADALPHLAYGVATHAALVRLERGSPDSPSAAPPARPSTLLRAAALGAATGSRSTAGTAALAFTSRTGDTGVAGRIGGRAGTTLAGLLAAGEAAADKHPAVPSRLAAPGLAPRLTLGVTSAAAMARRDGEDPALPGLVGLAGAAGAAVLGARARTAAARRLGSDRPGAIAEDVLAAALAWFGARRRSPDTAAQMTR
ncbi:hypothetical protein ACQP04_11170 [Pseudonocardia halophobica]|uniref:hypothetical protein n=1 Tax=Pseudonocardia halophobica TaxID=29401 RepID=UPI003D8AA0C9